MQLGYAMHVETAHQVILEVLRVSIGFWVVVRNFEACQVVFKTVHNVSDKAMIVAIFVSDLKL